MIALTWFLAGILPMYPIGSLRDRKSGQNFHENLENLAYISLIHDHLILSGGVNFYPCMLIAIK